MWIQQVVGHPSGEAGQQLQGLGPKKGSTGSGKNKWPYLDLKRPELKQRGACQECPWQNTQKGVVWPQITECEQHHTNNGPWQM
eukprot:1152977-Pelagomonas_calceolata.AAC.2